MAKKSETLVQFSLENTLEYWRNQYARARGKVLAYIANRFMWEHFPKYNIVTEFPMNIDIEVSSICNIQCDHCFRQYMDIKEDEIMSMDLYKKIVDECGEHKLFTLKFSMRGEPTCNPDLPEMIAYAKKKGVKEVWINTHGGNLTENLCEDILKAGVDWITVSFDGLGEMYESIRKPLKYEESLEKLKTLRRVRDKLKAKTILNVQGLWSAIKDDPEEYVRVMKGIVDRVVYNADMNFKEIMLVPDDDFVCCRLWQRLAITSNGDVLKCPSDFQKEEVIGNVAKNTIKELWDCEQQMERQKHLSGRKKESGVCQKCHHGSKHVPRDVKVGDKVQHDFDYEYNKEFKGVGLNRGK